jgi:hypothetical protein
LIAASGLGITAGILLLNGTHRSDELVNGLGATAAVLGITAIGCTIMLDTRSWDRFLIKSIRHFKK